MGPDLPYIDFTVQQHGPRDGLSCDFVWAWGTRWLPLEIVDKRMIKNVQIACLTQLRCVVTRPVLQGVGISMDLDHVQRD